MNTTWNENTKRWVGIILPLVLALISALVVSRFAASADFHEKTITALDDKKATVLELTAASTAASAAITLLPGDTATPIAEKLADITAYAAPLEKRGVALEIRRGDKVFYRSAGCKDVLGRARQIVAFDSEKNVYHFGQDGLVIVSHVQAGDQRCRLVLTGTGYTVADLSLIYI